MHKYLEFSLSFPDSTDEHTDLAVQRLDVLQLTLLISKGLLQHCQDDTVIQDKVPETMLVYGWQPGVFDQSGLIHQTTGRGRTTG